MSATSDISAFTGTLEVYEGTLNIENGSNVTLACLTTSAYKEVYPTWNTKQEKTWTPVFSGT